MMQHMAQNTLHIHVTSDRQVRNLIEITKSQEVRLCGSSQGKMRTVNDGIKEAEDANEVSDEGKEKMITCLKMKMIMGEERADFPDVAEEVDDGEDYIEYTKVKEEDEEEDAICFEDLK
ncbi:hypothetical protein DY000_02003240 [Brassica cretica]|uniref:Uncharacterized protein n=1 Tax=Brassica cretica TaxID=69181 RepID=A0ABQ7CI14_BRACR|nr:hypothetical protein DY000_02003240 [Brassica cretica]